MTTWIVGVDGGRDQARTGVTDGLAQWTNAAGERWMNHPNEPDTLVLLSTTHGPTHHVHTQPRAAVEARSGQLTQVATREENDRG